jgi:osmotically-inducible protein OsmY
MVVILSLNSCSSAVSVGAFIGNAGTSSKGIKKSFSDTYLKTKVLAKISLLDIKNIANISVNVSRGTILYTGYVMSAEKRLLIVKKTWEVEGVKKIINELKIDDDVPLSRRTNDFILRSKISTRLLFKSGINSNNFSVDVVDGEVYVIGLADNINEKAEIEKFLSGMTDIKKLITIIEIPKNLENE